MEQVVAATAQAWNHLGQPFRPADAAFLGCAGVKSSSDIAQIMTAAKAAGIAADGKITVANDLHNALAGGLAGRPGIALIAGTGTNCLGCDAAGKSFMCGGWGWLLDDVGGGFGLVLAAFRAVARSSDGRAPATLLLPAALAFLNLSEPNDLLARLYAEEWTPGQLAGFAPVVVRLANEGDAAARKILDEGACALAELVRGTAQALDFPAGPEVVILGGCARSGPPYQTLVENAIRAALPTALLREPIYSPTEGAALNALRAGGIESLPVLTFPT
jgi:N-acetylglucosamine kinase-like BadF-type ATPase